MKKNEANMKSPHDNIKAKQQKQFSNCFMKPSLSMNALPPEGIRENSELSPSRLRIDRPYNSLKVKKKYIILLCIFKRMKITYGVM
jgi:hypothetical protein